VDNRAAFPSDLAMVLITSQPENLSSEALAAVHSLIVVGDAATEVGPNSSMSAAAIRGHEGKS
jgi:hypothetical protein